MFAMFFNQITSSPQEKLSSCDYLCLSNTLFLNLINEFLLNVFLTGSAVPCCEAIGDDWNQLCLAWDSPAALHRGSPCSPHSCCCYQHQDTCNWYHPVFSKLIIWQCTWCWKLFIARTSITDFFQTKHMITPTKLNPEDSFFPPFSTSFWPWEWIFFICSF